MTFLERLWEFLGDFFTALGAGFNNVAAKLFGSANERTVKRMQSRVDAINALEPKFEAMSEDELKGQTKAFRERLDKGETLDDLLPEAFAAVREAGKRFLGMRHYDVQMIGGMVLHSGSIAEMVTGEGKTLVATLPTYLNALTGQGVHVITVNDYLARRDMEWMAPVYQGLGLTVAAIQNEMGAAERQKAYACDITYGTNNEFGFDYLRDNMRPAARDDPNYPKHVQQSQGKLNYAVIDEVDNILIDEARTPLIISGPAHDNVRKYADADRIARQLKNNVDFEVNEKDHNVSLTDQGVREAERLAGVESFYTAGNMEWPHLIDNALKAHYLYNRDVNYVLKEGRVVIVDEFTGRLMEGRQWSDGLHQAVEAKEKVSIKEETQTLATITLQNFFKLYNKLSGMTGTAMTEAGEFWKIYKLDVVSIPTNREMQRKEFPDLIYCTEKEKYQAIADDIERVNKWDTLTTRDGSQLEGKILTEQNGDFVFQAKQSGGKENIPKDKVRELSRRGRPVLVGTTSIEKSELLAEMLDRCGIKHEVLNAKQHKREAEIVAQAGRKGAVTIATNMAGRGTDIILGGNPETLAWAQLQDKYETRLDVPRDEWDALVSEIQTEHGMKVQGEEIKDLGGLYVIGTERHEARRIDLQLRGRCGRQGDPGSSRFYLSLEDDLMRIFAGPWVQKILQSIGMVEGEAIESRMVTRRIEAAQKKVEERNFEIRKNLLEYDEVMDEQRKRVYSYRQRILEGVSCKQLILDMIEDQVQMNLTSILEEDYGRSSFAAWAGSQLSTQLDPKDYRGVDFDEASKLALDEAERMAETQILDSIEENLPEDVEDEREWNWGALATMANVRFGLNLRDRDLKKQGRDYVDEFLVGKARDALQKVDLSEGKTLLEPEFGLRTAIGWVRHKFGIDIELDEIRNLDAAAIMALVVDRAVATYDDRESAYPVMAAFYRFGQKSSSGHTKIDRDALANWARDRFKSGVSIDDLKNKQRDEVRELLVAASRQSLAGREADYAEVRERVASLYAGAEDDQTAIQAAGSADDVATVVTWAAEKFGGRAIELKRMLRMPRTEFEQTLLNSVDEVYRPEMRRMERAVMLQVVDTAWKEHLLAMDHLRSAVGLVGYAQVDPKVEYKREGMKLFETMWDSVGERITDLIFRMEQLDEGFVGSTWVETSAEHKAAPPTSEIAQQQQAAIDGMQGNQGDNKVDPIRNRGERVGRNSPCPCGSGKKYKNCCLRKGGGGIAAALL